MGVGDFVYDFFDAKLGVMMMRRFVLRGFGLGPGSDISRTSPSGGVKIFLSIGEMDVRLGLIPHFALGPVAHISDPASPGGDSLMLRMGNVHGWFDVGGPEIGDIGITSPSRRVTRRVEAAGIFRNRINAVSRYDPVSTPSSLQAHLSVIRAARGRGGTHVAKSAPTKRFAATREGAVSHLGIFCGH